MLADHRKQVRRDRRVAELVMLGTPTQEIREHMLEFEDQPNNSEDEMGVNVSGDHTVNVFGADVKDLIAALVKQQEPAPQPVAQPQAAQPQVQESPVSTPETPLWKKALGPIAAATVGGAIAAGGLALGRATAPENVDVVVPPQVTQQDINAIFNEIKNLKESVSLENYTIEVVPPGDLSRDTDEGNH